MRLAWPKSSSTVDRTPAGQPRSGGWRAAAVSLLAVLAAVAAGCEPRVDASEARICRTAIPALNGEDAAIQVGRAAPGQWPNSIVIDYLTSAPNGPTRSRYIVCRFERHEPDARARIAGIATEAGPLSDTRFYFLRRFYLEMPGDPPPDPAETTPKAWNEPGKAHRDVWSR